MLLLKACLNGRRSLDEHPRVPLSGPELARDAVAAVRAGARAIHIHPRDEDGRESLEPAVVDPVVRAVKKACGVPVGVSTGAWIEEDPDRRAALVRGWTAPDFASVNLSEPGAAQVMSALLGAGIGVEAGVWSVEDAQRLASIGFGGRLTRVLVEILDGAGAQAAMAARAIDDELDRQHITAERLHHGEEEATWPVLRQAIELSRNIRIGLEDTLTLPDGHQASDNAELVAAAAGLLST